MTSWKKTALRGAVACTMLGFGAGVSADTLTLTFSNGTAASAIAGACNGIGWIAGAEFRMCDTSGAALGGGFPVQKDTIAGGETHTYTTNGQLTGVTGTPGNPGTTCDPNCPPSSAAPVASTNGTWQQNAGFFGPAFNFLAPTVGSLAGTAYGPAAYQLSGPPSNGALVTFIKAPVMEAQWGGTWFPLGQVGSAGVTFYANITGASTTGGTTTFTFEMFANELIDAAEDPGTAGFTGWTAQWHMQGTGSYVDTTSPTVSSTSPADGATSVSTSLASISVTFSEPMAPASVLAGAITVNGGVTVSAPTASNNNKTFSFPITSGALASSTTYTVTFNAGPTDAGGNAMTLPAAKTFTTAVAADTTNPTVSVRSPSSGATGVSANSTIVVTFSETMQASTASAITVAGVSGVVTANGTNTVFTFTPSLPLADSTQYTVTVAGATAKDASGLCLVSTCPGTDDAWSFTTAGAGQVIDRKIESNGKGNGFLAGCTMNPHAKFDPSLLAMLLGSFGFLFWRRRRGS